MSRVDVKTLSVSLSRAAAGDYAELLKFRLVSLVLVTTGIGFCMGFVGPADLSFFVRLGLTIAGTALVAGGAMALNQLMERETDARMHRTRSRPLPEGRVGPPEALVFGVTLSLAGTVFLAAAVNLLTGALGLLTVITYLLFYTPLKTRTPLCTIVGAVSGAIPPMMGYTAATGMITTQAWLLFAILFVWQMPHFLAIAWLYREDYARGGQMMLPVVEPTGVSTSRQMIAFTLALLPVTMMPAVIGMAGGAYFGAAMLLGLVFLGFAVAVAVLRTQRSARLMFIASIVYLPLLLAMLVLDRPGA